MIQTHCEFGLDTGLNHIKIHRKQITKVRDIRKKKTANKIQTLNDAHTHS